MMKVNNIQKHTHIHPSHTTSTVVVEQIVCDEHKGNLIIEALWDDVLAGNYAWQKAAIKFMAEEFSCSKCVNPSCFVCRGSKHKLHYGINIFLPRDKGQPCVELWEKVIICHFCYHQAYQLYHNMKNVIYEHPAWNHKSRVRQQGRFASECGIYTNDTLHPADVSTWDTIRELCFSLAELHCKRTLVLQIIKYQHNNYSITKSKLYVQVAASTYCGRYCSRSLKLHVHPVFMVSNSEH